MITMSFYHCECEKMYVAYFEPMCICKACGYGLSRSLPYVYNYKDSFFTTMITWFLDCIKGHFHLYSDIASELFVCNPQPNVRKSQNIRIWTGINRLAREVRNMN